VFPLLHPENVYVIPVVVKLGVVAVLIASLKVITTFWAIGTLVAPLLGVLAVTVGGVVSAHALVVADCDVDHEPVFPNASLVCT
jgi:hypothetical protein